MTVIDGIETEEIKVRMPEIQSAITNNDKIQDRLYVIMVVSNPCGYERRWKLAREFMARMEANEDVELFAVELSYSSDQEFRVTSPLNPRHLQIRTTTAPMWHKENMVNIAVSQLLPKEWRAMAWIDADLEFESKTWAADALKILNGSRDVLQLFSHCLDMDADERTMRVFHGLGFNYETKSLYCSNGKYFSHPGYAWAMTRRAYDRVGGLFMHSILGSGDHQMAQAFMGNANSVNVNCTQNYKSMLREWTKKGMTLRMGYTPGVIRHHFHGSKKNRQYKERWQILVKHAYDPTEHVTTDDRGLLVPTCACPPELLDDIMEYFRERKEDD